MDLKWLHLVNFKWLHFVFSMINMQKQQHELNFLQKTQWESTELSVTSWWLLVGSHIQLGEPSSLQAAFVQQVDFARWWHWVLFFDVLTHDASDTRSTTDRNRTLQCHYRENPAENQRNKRCVGNSSYSSFTVIKCDMGRPVCISFTSYLDMISVTNGNPQRQDCRRHNEGYPAGGCDSGGEHVT